MIKMFIMAAQGLSWVLLLRLFMTVAAVLAQGGYVAGNSESGERDLKTFT